VTPISCRCRMFVSGGEKSEAKYIGGFRESELVDLPLPCRGSARQALSAFPHARGAGGVSQFGVGRRLKLFQRRRSAQSGASIEMECDIRSLEIKTPYFNIERLGAIARRYTLNQYGMTSSHAYRVVCPRPTGGGVVAKRVAGGRLGAR